MLAIIVLYFKGGKRETTEGLQRKYCERLATTGYLCLQFHLHGTAFSYKISAALLRK